MPMLTDSIASGPATPVTNASPPSLSAGSTHPDFAALVQGSLGAASAPSDGDLSCAPATTEDLKGSPGEAVAETLSAASEVVDTLATPAGVKVKEQAANGTLKSGDQPSSDFSQIDSPTDDHAVDTTVLVTLQAMSARSHGYRNELRRRPEHQEPQPAVQQKRAQPVAGTEVVLPAPATVPYAQPSSGKACITDGALGCAVTPATLPAIQLKPETAATQHDTSETTQAEGEQAADSVEAMDGSPMLHRMPALEGKRSAMKSGELHQDATAGEAAAPVIAAAPTAQGPVLTAASLHHAADGSNRPRLATTEVKAAVHVAEASRASTQVLREPVTAQGAPKLEFDVQDATLGTVRIHAEVDVAGEVRVGVVGANEASHSALNQIAPLLHAAVEQTASHRGTGTVHVGAVVAGAAMSFTTSSQDRHGQSGPQSGGAWAGGTGNRSGGDEAGEAGSHRGTPHRTATRQPPADRLYGQGFSTAHFHNPMPGTSGVSLRI